MFSAGCCYFLPQGRRDFGSNLSCATGESSYLSGPLFFLFWKTSRLNRTIPRTPSDASSMRFHVKNRNHGLSLRLFGGIKQHGRNYLPWQNSLSAIQILVSKDLKSINPEDLLGSRSIDISIYLLECVLVKLNIFFCRLNRVKLNIFFLTFHFEM